MKREVSIKLVKREKQGIFSATADHIGEQLSSEQLENTLATEYIMIM